MMENMSSFELWLRICKYYENWISSGTAIQFCSQQCLGFVSFCEPLTKGPVRVSGLEVRGQRSEMSLRLPETRPIRRPGYLLHYTMLFNTQSLCAHFV